MLMFFLAIIPFLGPLHINPMQPSEKSRKDLFGSASCLSTEFDLLAKIIDTCNKIPTGKPAFLLKYDEENQKKILKFFITGPCETRKKIFDVLPDQERREILSYYKQCCLYLKALKAISIAISETVPTDGIPDEPGESCFILEVAEFLSKLKSENYFLSEDQKFQLAKFIEEYPLKGSAHHYLGDDVNKWRKNFNAMLNKINRTHHNSTIDCEQFRANFEEIVKYMPKQASIMAPAVSTSINHDYLVHLKPNYPQPSTKPDKKKKSRRNRGTRKGKQQQKIAALEQQKSSSHPYQTALDNLNTHLKKIPDFNITKPEVLDAAPTHLILKAFGRKYTILNTTGTADYLSPEHKPIDMKYTERVTAFLK